MALFTTMTAIGLSRIPTGKISSPISVDGSFRFACYLYKNGEVVNDGSTGGVSWDSCGALRIPEVLKNMM